MMAGAVAVTASPADLRRCKEPWFMAKFNRDNVAGLILLAFSLLLAFYLTPNQVEARSGGPLALSPRLFCYLSSGLLGVLSCILFFSNLKQKTATAAAETGPGSWEPIMRGLSCTVLACLYVVLANFLGFFVSTALAMTVFLFYFGVRKWYGILLFQLVVLGFIYLLFVKALKVVMPDGILF